MLVIKFMRSLIEFTGNLKTFTSSVHNCIDSLARRQGLLQEENRHLRHRVCNLEKAVLALSARRESDSHAKPGALHN